MNSKITFFSLPGWLQEILDDSFKKYLCLALLCLGIFLILFPGNKKEILEDFSSENTIHFFYHPNCSHCADQKKFNLYLTGKYPELSLLSHDTSQPDKAMLLLEFARQKGIPPAKMSVPVTIAGPYVIIGFDSAATTGMTIEKATAAYLAGDPSLFTASDRKWLAQETIDLPLIGRLRIAEYSLPALAVIIGLTDGFNPCAMWVLVYLISLIISINDRKKIWLLVGTFVLSSGILYFLFMTAWLNVFLYIGYLRPLTIAIGLFALGAGILHIRQYLSKKEAACKMGDSASRQKTMGRIEKIVHQPLTLSTMSAIFMLAFIVNSIEFACSAALPAIFTHILSLRDLTNLEYYGYILLYDFFFMLDDLIIFSLAALAISSDTGQKYTKQCVLIGGIVLVVLGLMLAFKPEFLR